jgi:large repetitive protein
MRSHVTGATGSAASEPLTAAFARPASICNPVPTVRGLASVAQALRAAVMLSGVVVVLLLPAAAHADRDFAIRYTANDAGSITFAANTLMTCPGPPGPANPPTTCDAARAGTQTGTLGNNNGHFMTYVDADGVPGTFNSSSAVLTLPKDAVVKWAGLYWAGDTAAGSREPATREVPAIPAGSAAPTPTLRNTVSLRGPGEAAYEPVTA